MGAMTIQITSLTIVYSTVIQAQIKENIKAPRHWPLCGEFTGDRGEFPAQMANNVENVCIWWRHHVEKNKHDEILWHLHLHPLQWHHTSQMTGNLTIFKHLVQANNKDIPKLRIAGPVWEDGQ